MNIHAVKMGIFLFLFSFAVQGCTLIQLKRDVDQSLGSTVIVGRVYAKASGEGPIVVAACATGQEKEIAHYTVLHDTGEYELMVAPGNYHLFAYRDENRNLVYEAGEPAGQYGDGEGVRAPAVGVVYDIDVIIPEGGGKIVMAPGTRISPVRPRKLPSRQAGAITDLDDERFSEEHGREGFWTPITFFKKFGGNIYFLEEYDPRKTPVLFIHGAGGTPKGWWYVDEKWVQHRRTERI